MIDRSRLMRAAWAKVRRGSLTDFSRALTAAWREARLGWYDTTEGDVVVTPTSWQHRHLATDGALA